MVKGWRKGKKGRRGRRGRKVKRWREIEIAGTRGAESREEGEEGEQGSVEKKKNGGRKGRHMPAGKLSVSPAPDSIIKISQYSRALVIVRSPYHADVHPLFSPLAPRDHCHPSCSRSATSLRAFLRYLTRKLFKSHSRPPAVADSPPDPCPARLRLQRFSRKKCPKRIF